MNTRKIVIGAVVVVIGLPVVLVLIAAVSFYALMSFYAPNRTNGTIVSSGHKREYLLYVPRSYDRADKYEVAAVKRVAVVLQSGVRAWAYVDARYAPSDSCYTANLRVQL